MFPVVAAASNCCQYALRKYMKFLILYKEHTYYGYTMDIIHSIDTNFHVVFSY